MTRTMYDSVTWQAIPANAAMVAGYDETSIYAWPPEAWARFARAVKVRISVTDQGTGHVLDVERGDATPDQAPGWAHRRRLAGADPSVYMDYATWPTVVQAFHAQGEPQPHYWAAAYPGGGAVIPPGAVAHQFANPPGSGGNWDLSVVADYWPGIDLVVPPPPNDAALLEELLS